MNDNGFCTIISKKPGCFLLLGACPALAAAADLQAGLTMGLLAMVSLPVLTLLALALRGLLAKSFRLPVFVLLAVAQCAAVRMVLHAQLPQVYASLGTGVTLLAVAVAVYATAQAEVPFGTGLGNAAKAGLGFLAATVMTSALCELLGSGSIWGVEISALSSWKNAVLTQPAGRILIYGLAAAALKGLFPEKKEAAL